KVLVLGCTHYPLLRQAIAEITGTTIALVDSGEQTAQAVVHRLTALDARSERADTGTLSCYVSDNPQRFRELGQRFCGHSIVDVTWVPHDQFLSHDAPAVA